MAKPNKLIEKRGRRVRLKKVVQGRDEPNPAGGFAAITDFLEKPEKAKRSSRPPAFSEATPPAPPPRQRRSHAQCPACGEQTMLASMVMNSLSRYVTDTYICSSCGKREAAKGFFWKERAYSLNLGAHIKKDYI